MASCADTKGDSPMAASSSDAVMDDAPAPEVDAGPSAEELAAELAAMPEVSLDIFDVIKSSRAQHGLRHGDYLRYRQYCARRLHRIRKTLKLTQGKGRFVKKPLEPRMVKEGRHLLLPLICSERAWSYAMQLKRESSQDNPRPRFHLLARLSKAAKFAGSLSELCATRGDKRTALEAEAYAAFMLGNVSLEREQWGEALQHLKRTRTICSELGRVSLAEHAHLYQQTVEEVEPSIRFCAYNLRRESGEEGEADEDMEMLAEAEGTSDILRSKLEAVLQESRARQALDFSEIDVLGERLPIKNEKARVAFLASQQQLLEIKQASAAGTGDVIALYDQLMVAFNDALDAIRSDARQLGKDSSAKAGVAAEQLRKLQAHLQWQKLTHSTQQRLLLIGKQKEGGGRKGSAEDLVRLYETVQAHQEEMRALDGYKDSEPHMQTLAAQSASVATFRCFYVGESYAAVSKWAEAQALYTRALERLGDALGLFEGAAANAVPGDTACAEGVASLRALEQQIEGAKARAHAQAFISDLSGGPAVEEAQEQVEGLAVESKPSGVAELMDSLHTFKRAQYACARTTPLQITDDGAC